MGKLFPNYPGDVQDGDEPSQSPNKTHKSVLGVERGTQYTRRIETDASSNAYVHVAADDTNVPVSASATGSLTSVTANTLSTIATHTPVAAYKLSKISCSGTHYAKYQLFINSTLIDTKRSGPERSLEFTFPTGLSVSASAPVEIKVTHYQAGQLADFNATIYGA